MTENKIRLLGDRILVEPDKAEDTTASGLIIVESAQEKPQRGTVVNVGVGAELNVGDKIMYGKYAGTDIQIDGEEYLIMREDDILVVIQ